MKKRLLFSAIALLTSLSASAQCTADPQYVDPGVYPDSATGMAAACIDVPYSETITIIVPYDTTTIVFGIPFTFVFDSIVVDSWDWGGLTGFTYQCSSPGNVISPVDNCSFEGDQTGCILVEGNPTAADIGSYQQEITTVAYLPGAPGNPNTVLVDYYYIQVLDCGLSLPTLTDSKFLVYPNPAKSVITLNGLNGIDVESILVTDMEGKVLESYENVIGPALDMDIDYLQSGMYFITINYNSTSEVVKFIKE
jgi:hypothetical protein